MKNIGRLLLGFSLLFIIILGYFFWRSYFGSKSSTTYDTEKVRRGNITQTVAANGTLNPVILVNVGTQVTGKVQKIYADFNDHVNSGQILLELDPALLKTAVLQSMAAVNKAKANLALAISNEKRGIKLYQRDFIAKQDWEQLSETRKAVAADLKLAEAKLAQDQTNLDYATIRSPVSGVVINRQVDVGQTVTASFQTPILFQIAQDLSKMQIDSSFAEADIGNIASGQEAIFTVDAFPHKIFSGVVKQIRLSPSVQQNVVTYNVVINVENKEGLLLPGMTAYVKIKTAEHKDVLLIPNAALRFKPKVTTEKNQSIPIAKVGTRTVYRVVGSEIERVTCQTGITDNIYTEITSNELKEGDLLAVGYSQKQQPLSAFRIRVF